MDYKIYEDLDIDQQELLCFYAFVGETVDGDLLGRYIKCTSGRRPQTISNVSKLLEKGLLQSSIYNWRSSDYLYSITAAHYLQVLHFLFVRHEEWLELFEALVTDRKEPFVTMSDSLKESIAKKEVTSILYNFTGNMIPYFIPVGLEPDFSPIILSFPEQIFGQFFVKMILHLQEQDIFDADDRMPQLLAAKKNLSDVRRQELTEILALYRYFSHGEYDARKKRAPKSLYALLLEGIHALQWGEKNKALEYLSMALKLRNKQAADKNLFINFLNCFYLMMAYVHDGSEESMTKLRQFLKKKVIMQDRNFLPARIVAEWYTDSEQRTPNELIDWLLLPIFRGDGRNAFKCLGFLFAKYFNLEQFKNLDPAQFIPNQLILKHELSAYLPLSEECRSQLKAIYGTQPVLTSIRRKQLWELVLEELSEIEDKGGKLPEKQVRLMYIIHGYRSEVEVREQTRLSSGKWGSGKPISGIRYRTGDLDFMDEADRIIHERWMNKGGYYLTIEDALPNLVGSDRVYMGKYAPFEQVKITEEKPYLIVEKKATGFALSSNVPKTDLESSRPVIVKRSETHYVVIPMTVQQRNYYNRLLSLDAFPLEAEDLLKEFFPKIAHQVEVHSSLIEGGSTLETIAGVAEVGLQIHPQGSCFRVCFFARPLHSGKGEFVPGKGAALVVDEKEGTRYQVKRKLSKEREIYDALIGFIEDSMNKSVDNENVVLYPDELVELLEYIQQSPECYFVEWPEGEKLRLKTSPASTSWNISLNSKGNWFEIEGDVRIDDETVLTMAQFLELLGRSKGKYVRLNDKDYMRLSDSIRKQLRRLESLAVPEHGKMQVSAFHAGLLGEIRNGELEIAYDDALESLWNKLESSKDLIPAIPSTLQATLRDYQIDGYHWMARLNHWGAGACLADDMGLGKTVQTIAYLLYKAADGPSLVVAPASVVPNWRKELLRFAPTLKPLVLNEADNRTELLASAKGYDVVLSTYGLLVTEMDALTSKEWNIVCLDEAHTIKNRDTKTSGAAMRLNAANRLLLTGTPIQNHLGELWNLFRFINPGLLGNYDQFHRKYIVPIEQEADKERQQQLKRIVHPFMLRRTKAEVVEELPDKMEIVLPVELSEEEMGVYEVIRRKAEAMLEESKSINVNALTEITRLRQAACSAALIEKKWKGENSKINLFLDLMNEIKEGGNRVLVFSQFTSFLKLVCSELDKAGVKYLYLDGSVTMKQRERLVQEFQQGSCQLFVISLKAGGLGLNLTGANYVIHLDPWWNPAIEQQATDRAYRIGQQQNVTVYHLIAQHTIEEKILRLHQTKRDLADSLLEGTDMSHKLTGKDLLEILSKDI